jgi:DNA-binding transcriptional regulator LsrR (DeoR family)
MTRVNHPSNRNVAEVAWLYYIKNLNQGEIAKAMNLSRPTVISYLRLARERQIVCVKISGDHFRLNATADALKERFGLTSAVCEAAAQFLPDFVQPGDELGVSWGQTLWFVSESVPWWPVERLTVRQLIGSMANPLLPTSESCSTEIARRLSAACINLNAPAVCSTPELAEMLRAEPIIAEQLENLSRCNKAIYSLSDCSPDTHVVQFHIATEGDIADYVHRGPWASSPDGSSTTTARRSWARWMTG